MSAHSSEASVDETLVALIVKEFRGTTVGYLGRTAIQKLCYFAQALGVPINYNFRIYFYGPYSDDLAFDIEMLMASDTLRDTSSDRERYSNFRLGDNAEKLFQSHPAVVNRFQPIVKNVASAFGRLDPQTLELLSTLHFVDRKIKAGGIEHPDKSLVISDFRQVKQDRFSDEQIDRAYEALRTAGLVS